MARHRRANMLKGGNDMDPNSFRMIVIPCCSVTKVRNGICKCNPAVHQTSNDLMCDIGVDCWRERRLFCA